MNNTDLDDIFEKLEENLKTLREKYEDEYDYRYRVLAEPDGTCFRTCEIDDVVLDKMIDFHNELNKLIPKTKYIETMQRVYELVNSYDRPFPDTLDFSTTSLYGGDFKIRDQGCCSALQLVYRIDDEGKIYKMQSDGTVEKELMGVEDIHSDLILKRT